MSVPVDQLALGELLEAGQRIVGRRGFQPPGFGQDPRNRGGIPGAVAQLEDQRGRRVQVMDHVVRGVEHDQSVLGLVDLERVGLPGVHVGHGRAAP